jgi:hypothetical protein
LARWLGVFSGADFPFALFVELGAESGLALFLLFLFTAFGAAFGFLIGCTNALAVRVPCSLFLALTVLNFGCSAFFAIRALASLRILGGAFFAWDEASFAREVVVAMILPGALMKNV